MVHALTLLCLLLWAAAAHGLTHINLGDRLLRDYAQFIPLPLTSYEALSQGWVQTNSSCISNLGTPFNAQEQGPVRSKPITLYYNGAGQITGMGLRLYGNVKSQLIVEGYYVYVGNGEYQIDITFRDPSQACSDKASSYPLGDRLVINAPTLGQEIPLTAVEAAKSNWTKGACFAGMGYNFFKDLQSGPRMSWKAANLLPVSVSYNNGTINAFSFLSSVVQQQFINSNCWDKVAAPNFLMCKNWCDPNCKFTDTKFWSTMHLYMNDYKEVTCNDNCKFACCK